METIPLRLDIAARIIANNPKLDADSVLHIADNLIKRERRTRYDRMRLMEKVLESQVDINKGIVKGLFLGINTAHSFIMNPDSHIEDITHVKNSPEDDWKEFIHP